MYVQELPNEKIRVIFDVSHFHHHDAFWKWVDSFIAEMERQGFRQQTEFTSSKSESPRGSSITIGNIGDSIERSIIAGRNVVIHQPVYNIYPTNEVAPTDKNEVKIESVAQQEKCEKPIRARIFADVDIGNVKKGEATTGVFGSGAALIEAISEWASLDPKNFDYSWFLLNAERSRQSIADLDKLSDSASPGTVLYLSNRFG